MGNVSFPGELDLAMGALHAKGGRKRQQQGSDNYQHTRSCLLEGCTADQHMLQKQHSSGYNIGKG
jgi:hypothetical protein